MAGNINIHRAGLLFILMHRRRQRLRAACCSSWCKTLIQKHQGHGVYANLLRELEGEEPESCRQYYGLDINLFE